jgi:hypothetical protein
MRYEVLTAVPTMFWYVTPCNLVDVYQRIGETIAPNSEYFSTLKMEISDFFETLCIIHQITRRHKPGDCSLGHVPFEIHSTCQLPVYFSRSPL